MDDCINGKMCDLRHQAVETCIQKLDTKFTERLNAMDYALKLRTTELDRRLSTLNQLREELIQDRSEFVKSARYEDYHKQVMVPMIARLERLEARWALIISGYGIAITVIAWIVYLFFQHIQGGK